MRNNFSILLILSIFYSPALCWGQNKENTPIELDGIEINIYVPGQESDEKNAAQKPQSSLDLVSSRELKKYDSGSKKKKEPAPDKKKPEKPKLIPAGQFMQSSLNPPGERRIIYAPQQTPQANSSVSAQPNAAGNASRMKNAGGSSSLTGNGRNSPNALNNSGKKNGPQMGNNNSVQPGIIKNTVYVCGDGCDLPPDLPPNAEVFDGPIPDDATVYDYDCNDKKQPYKLRRK